MLICAFFDSAISSAMCFGLDFVVEDDHVRHVAGQCHRCKIFQRIVAEFGLHEGIDSKRPVRANQQRVAVGCRARHGFSANAAAGAAAVVDHDRLAEGTRNSLADQAPDDVGITAGSERHNQPDRPVGIGSKGCAWQQHCRRGKAKGGNQCAA